VFCDRTARIVRLRASLVFCCSDGTDDASPLPQERMAIPIEPLEMSSERLPQLRRILHVQNVIHKASNVLDLPSKPEGCARSACRRYLW